MVFPLFREASFYNGKQLMPQHIPGQVLQVSDLLSVYP